MSFRRRPGADAGGGERVVWAARASFPLGGELLLGREALHTKSADHARREEHSRVANRGCVQVDLVHPSIADNHGRPAQLEIADRIRGLLPIPLLVAEPAQYGQHGA